MRNKPAIYIKLWPNSLMTAGKDTFIDEIITLAGGKNIAAGFSQRYPTLTAEYLLANPPDIVVLAYPETTESGLPPVLRQRLLNPAQSVRPIARVSADLVLRPAPRILEGIRQLREIAALRSP
jgi:iron complex transport system substrate-binding protein